MKHAKKLASLLLALVMALALAVPAFAAGETGSITINKAIPGETYKIYKIFDLESYDPTAGTYAYKIEKSSSWYAFVTDGGGKDYVSIDGQDYVTWNMGKDNQTAYDAFAKAALLYAQNNNNVEATKSTTAEGSGDTTTVTFNNLDLGYYLVDSSLGTLAILGPASPSFTKDEKNEVPNVDKKVQEDSDNQYGTSNTADIGQEVTFQTTITVKGGARNYVLHDKMTGLTFQSITSIQWKEATTYDETTGYTYGDPKSLTESTDYTLSTSDLGDDCTFEVSFQQSFLDKLDTGDQIVVTYSATVNTNAVVGGEGNPNKTHLTYGDTNRSTPDDETKTYTYSFDLVKTKSDNTVLNGAKFELYDAETGGNQILLVKESNGIYRVATAAEQEEGSFASAVIEAGKVTIKGLDSGTYWLEETQQPKGYNKLDGRQKVEITNKNLSTTMTSDTWSEGDGGVHVVNNTGSELPSTGGMGTTIFYVLGGVLMAGAVVLLITKKRMGQTEK